MARLAQATVLVEANETSGTRNQVEACFALGRAACARRGFVEGVSWLRDVRARAVVEWESTARLTEPVAAEESARLRAAS